MEGYRNRFIVRPHIIFILVLITSSVLYHPDAGAEEISVHLEVESRDVYLGESFLIQVVVDGSDEAEPPDLSSLEGFTAEYIGGSNNSSQSITIINGRVERIVHKGFIFTYRLIPKETGDLVIPPFRVRIEGQTFSTRPVTIAVRRPTETKDFKLRINLSRETCYVGEPVVLTVTWYLRKDVENFMFTAPVLDNAAFFFEDPEITIDKSKRYYRVPLGPGEVIAEKGRGILDGERYATLAFNKVLIPRRPGTFVIPEVVVACEASSGVSFRRDFLDDFFRDDFFGLRRGTSKKYVVPSNTLSLQVKDLPQEGKPAGFTGHIGEYKISATAEPTEVNVGDPITLQIVLEGPDYLGSVDLPPLNGQSDLARDFKIPDERADGKIEGKKKIFTQTIRAVHDEVAEIPPIRLVYFDTKRERYTTALSDAIPIIVHATKVITALDAEGIEPGPAGTPIERWKEGIAYNYYGHEMLEPQVFGMGSLISDVRLLAALVLPPFAYIILLGSVTALRRHHADPMARKARGAHKQLRKRLILMQRADVSAATLCENVMEALRNYLGAKLYCAGTTLTAADIERMLGERGVAPETIELLRDVMSTCEAGAYARDSSAAADRENLVQNVMDAVRELEKVL